MGWLANIVGVLWRTSTLQAAGHPDPCVDGCEDARRVKASAGVLPTTSHIDGGLGCVGIPSALTCRCSPFLLTACWSLFHSKGGR